MSIKGNAWKFGNDINTDEIIPARHLNSSDPAELAKYCMEDADKEFMNKMSKGDIIVAGSNFGCGSSREHAPIAIKAAGISCVIAKTFARIFYRNSFNMGLLILESPEAVDAISEGDNVEVNMDDGTINNLTGGKSFKATPIPPFMQTLLEKGGLMASLKSKGKYPLKP